MARPASVALAGCQEPVLALGLPLKTLTQALGHGNFHCSIYLETRERKGLRFGLARGVPCAPGLLFGLAGAYQSGLRAFPAVGFAYAGECLQFMTQSEAQPGVWDMGHRSSIFSLESLKKYDLENQLSSHNMP